jgi:hypothetical protein
MSLHIEDRMPECAHLNSPTPGQRRKRAKLHKQQLRPENAVMNLGGPRLYQPLQAISYLLILLGSRMPVIDSISGFFGEINSAHSPGTMHRLQ